ncbi:trypsin-like serine protease [Vibrio parahaemolyticus]|uniref:trypsin-like serine protease n=1 Tax=Vibrio parahaemolyticus TaxID=670 RepID=UPI00132F00C3|nr:trypsin-like serine protease [Vibrio parahaemolyticus]MDN4712427.1 trypsin-like serine protease [Vibrio parahaemolyticus]MDN4715002.1 trypsin-like serine protease [Vibrio parahaemolyticus]MDN4720249.1 trypsin-like serine protease [Vibrio parahaemolyticus]MDN4720340.1 trypsin-like serine protease [Vibrio parahaemolyticus]MDN4723912.1 trypsin-like serine protease [Vibrio parahaemolyticus]
MRLPSLSLIALSLLSASSYAVENGTPVDWSQHDDTVRLDNSTNKSLYCTATLISGRYAITAGHCVNDGGLDIMTPSNSENLPLSAQWLSLNTPMNMTVVRKTLASFVLITLSIIAISSF